jgi:hypothetical protein
MRSLKTAWTKWKKVARVVGNFQALIIFTIFYYIILWIAGIPSALFSDNLNIKKKLKSNFSSWDYPDEDLNQALKPY